MTPLLPRMSSCAFLLKDQHVSFLSIEMNESIRNTLIQMFAMDPFTVNEDDRKNIVNTFGYFQQSHQSVRRRTSILVLFSSLEYRFSFIMFQ